MATFDRWVVERDGKIENIVVWDGGEESTWEPPEGTTVRPWQEGDEIYVEPTPEEG